MSSTFNSKQLRHFVPLAELSPDNFVELASKVKVEVLPASKKLFSRGDEDDFSYYLLEGELELFDADGNSTSFISNTKESRHPIDGNKPRKKSAITKTQIYYFKVDNNLLDLLLTWDQNKNYIVNEIDENEADDDTDWMTQLLQLEIFRKIPPANIQVMFQRIQSVSVKKDDIVIKQDDEGDYYYIIQSGSCRVMQNSNETGNKEIKIADLASGSGFGEEALVSDAPRNATIIMNTDGQLMRLAKEDFVALLKEPIIKSVDFTDAKNMINEGAVWLDVRLTSEHENKNIPDSINIPLFLLRSNSSELSNEIKYIVYCDTGSRSASATYILNERGYDAYLLEGGLNQNP